MIEPTCQVTEYTISLLPPTSADYTVWAVKVEFRGFDKWAVTNMELCLNNQQEWVHEILPSERDDKWLAEHRFDEQTAIELAKQAVETVCWNGLTARDILSRQS